MSKLPEIKTMHALVTQSGADLVPFRRGEVIEVSVIAKSRKKIIVDVAGWAHGFIPEKEFSFDTGDLKIGDKILALVLEEENIDGYVVLSLKKADKERFYKSLQDKITSNETLLVLVKDANRGGLVVSYGFIEGFIPSSQLAYHHYPRVGQDFDKILAKLKNLVGKNLKVKVLSFDKNSSRVIFSEKAAGDDTLSEKIGQYKVGQILDGKITAVVNFGLFVDLGDIEGLVHISEVSWSKIDNLSRLYKVGDSVKAIVTSIENNKISLSIKKLTPDPWQNLVKNYKIGQIVDGKVVKITPFGVICNIEKGVDGLVSNSKDKKIEEFEYEMDKIYKFEILSIDADSHKISLIGIVLDKKDKKLEEESPKKLKKPKKTDK